MKLSLWISALYIHSAALAAEHAFPKVSSGGGGSKFEVDGKTGYLRGTNGYWIPFLQSDADIDLVMDHIAASGMKLLRTWGFNDVAQIPGNNQAWFQSFIKGQAPAINTGPTGLQRLDHVVRAAEKRGIKLLIPFINNWGDYGGMPAYIKHYDLPAGNDGKNTSAFYTSSACQAQYQKYIRAVVTRYANSSAIFAWQLANEPRCNGCDWKIVNEWARKTSKYIKSLDPGHMVAMGDEGFGLPGDKSYPYSFNEGVNFVENLKIPDIDFGTMHLYPESWNIAVPAGSDWVKNHASACAAAKKPCLFEEYGVKATDKCASVRPWQQTALSSIAGDLFWQMGDQFSWGKAHDDGNTVYPGSGNWKCMVEQHGADVKAKGGI